MPGTYLEIRLDAANLNAISNLLCDEANEREQHAKQLREDDPRKSRYLTDAENLRTALPLIRKVGNR